jgi:hypothetical protein
MRHLLAISNVRKSSSIPLPLEVRSDHESWRCCNMHKQSRDHPKSVHVVFSWIHWVTIEIRWLWLADFLVILDQWQVDPTSCGSYLLVTKSMLIWGLVKLANPCRWVRIEVGMHVDGLLIFSLTDYQPPNCHISSSYWHPSQATRTPLHSLLHPTPRWWIIEKSMQKTQVPNLHSRISSTQKTTHERRTEKKIVRKVT